MPRPGSSIARCRPWDRTGRHHPANRYPWSSRPRRSSPCPSTRPCDGSARSAPWNRRELAATCRSQDRTARQSGCWLRPIQSSPSRSRQRCGHRGPRGSWHRVGSASRCRSPDRSDRRCSGGPNHPSERSHPRRSSRCRSRSPYVPPAAPARRGRHGSVSTSRRRGRSVPPC